jgi:hypothetical protein
VNADGRVGEERAVSGARDDHVLDRLQVRQQRGEQGEQRTVGDDHAVGGVVDDPGQLLGREAEVQGVQDRAHGRDREVRLDVFRVVPGQGRHALVAGDTEVVPQRVGQLGRAGADLRVGAAVRLVLTGPGGHLRCPVDRRPVGQDPRDQQRYVLHRAQHGVLPGATLPTRW